MSDGHPYRSAAQVVEGAASIEGRLYKLRALLATTHRLEDTYDELGGECADDFIEQLVQDARRAHVALIEEHLEARFKRIEDKLAP